MAGNCSAELASRTLRYACPHPRAELDAVGDFLRREIRREIRAADLGVVQRAAFHVPRAEVEAAQVGVAHVRAADDYLVQVRDAAEVDAAEVGIGEVDFLPAGDLSVEAVEVANAQRIERPDRREIVVVPS